MFTELNLNPKGWKTQDCVIRACAKATNKTWDDTFKELCEIAFKKKRLPNDEKVFDKFLLNNGFTYCKQMKIDGKPLNVYLLVNYYGKDYILVIHTRRHLTCSVQGTVYDIWNTLNEKTGYYYIKRID